ncbi:Dimethyl-sulfide monooxygenase [Colletotrichum sp. SAR 10_75]|nr:Dimethyl-sulfide monooxygenase [Colletotrichum sp. SAR 10_75]
MTSSEAQNESNDTKAKKQILLNAFDMFTVGHLSFGQWRNPKDRAKDKRRDLTYWTDLAKLLDKGGFVGLFLADTFGPYDTYKGSAEPSVGLPLVEHDTRYENADEYLRVLYKLWEGSWSDTALKEDAENGIYSDYSQIRPIHHHGKFHVDAPFLTDPSPQRTPVLFQAGTSPAGIKFGSTHAEGIFVAGLSPHVVAPRVKAIREGAIAAGRDPYSVKVFAMITPIIGKDEEDAKLKYEEALKYVLIEGGLAQFSATTGIDVSKFDLDHELTEKDVANHLQRIHSSLYNLRYRGDDVPKLTPRNLGTVTAIGGNGAMPVGTAAQVADIFQEWVDIADVDGFNIGYVITPGSFEDAVEYLVPELRSRGLLPEAIPAEAPAPTFREQMYGLGQKGLRSDHPGFKYKYDTYEETIAKEEATRADGGSEKT